MWSLYLFVSLLVAVPTFDVIEYTAEEIAVAMNLVLRTARHHPCDVTEDLAMKRTDVVKTGQRAQQHHSFYLTHSITTTVIQPCRHHKVQK